MNNESTPTRAFCWLCGWSGIAGVLLLVISFNINSGPTPGASPDELAAFGHQHYASILWGAWLQAVGPFLMVLFALALVNLAGAIRRLSGMMTLFGAGTLMTVSLIEITFYIAVLFKDPPLSTLVGMNVIYSVQHLYFIIGAPALFLPLGFVLLDGKVLPAAFAWSAILLGVVFAILGMAFLLKLILPLFVTAFAAIQILWWLSAAVALMMRASKLSVSAANASG